VWRLFQMVIIFLVGMWMPWWVVQPGQQRGVSPGVLGMVAVFLATRLVSWLIDVARWLGGPAARPLARSVGLHDQTSSNPGRLTAVRLQLHERTELWPRPRIGQDRR
jgi:hypothetical protein